MRSPHNADNQKREGAALRKRIVGCLWGTAVGDALGLPFEGLSRERIERRAPDLSRYHFLFGRGMVSDDTEHACMVATALIVSGGDERAFQRSLARQMRVWFLCVPAGVGLATLRACQKLCVGVSPERSGVFSAGNGPAMRAPLLGVLYGEDQERLRALVAASTRITHTDPKAFYGALAVAVAAAMGAQDAPITGDAYLLRLHAALHGEGAEMLTLAEQAVESARQEQPAQEFAASLGCERGVSGYIYHTVPVGLQVWLRHAHHLPAALQEVISCGGDTDTTGAIVGGMVGATVGESGIPVALRAGIWEPIRSFAWMERLGESLSQTAFEGKPQRSIGFPGFLIPFRNLVFLLIVLGHGFRRLFPPY